MVPSLEERVPFFAKTAVIIGIDAWCLVINDSCNGFQQKGAIDTGATAIPIVLKWHLPLGPVAVEAHL